MILNRLALRNFRGVKDARFDALSEKLCLFYGPNESGKSTLVEGLHFGLFEKAKGEAEHKREVWSWGGDDAPEVEVSFTDDNGETWHVHKRFLDRPFTTLEGRNVVAKDADAEARLRAIFGTRPGGNRAMKPEELGIWPLLWVRQGQSGTPTRDALVPDARALLTSSLGQQTGAMIAGPLGLAVRTRAADAYARWWTPTGKRNAARVAVDEAFEAAERDLLDARERFAATRRMAVDLADAERQVGSLEGRIREQRLLVDAAEARARAADDASRALEVVSRELVLLRQAEVEADGRAKERASLDQAWAVLDATLTKGEARVAEAEALRDAREVERARARTEAEIATSAARRAREVVDRVTRRAERDGLAARADELAERITRATAHEADARHAVDAIDRIPVRPDDLTQLEDRVRARDVAKDRLDGASSRVVFTALQPTTIDGKALAVGEALEVRFESTKRVVVDDRLAIELRPGEVGWEDLAIAYDDARTRLSRSLQTLGVSSVGEARQLVEERRELERRRFEHQKAFEVLAPGGILALREQLEAARAAIGAVDDDGDLPSLVEARATWDKADAREVAASTAAREADARSEAARTAWSEARSAVRSDREKRDALAGKRSSLADAGSLAVAAERARAALTEASAKVESHRKAFDAAGGEGATRAVREERAALQALVGRRDAVREEIGGRRATLAERLEEGLHERVQEAEVAVERARARAAQVAHEAEVLRVAHEAVEDAWGRQQERFVEPVRRAVERYVGLLFPGSSLAFDDSGDVVGLQTHGVLETFDQLSGGAREQLGVLVRLGLAEVLAGERRLPVLLDDALVNSDANRRSRMVEVLRRASERLQILVFTCHEEDFDRLGAAWFAEVRGRPPRTA